MKQIRPIDRGGFGKVDEVELPDGRRVARKTLSPIYPLEEPDKVKLHKRFEREVKVQSSLPSRIVLPVLDADLGSDNPWYTMPLAERNYRTQIDEDRAAGIINIEPIADMMNALEELHELGFVHRDLKPENLLMHEGRWKLSDFGLVMPLSDQTSRWTSTGYWAGTEAYMAPEQKTSFRDVTHAADIYSVGCIIHDLVSGEPRVPYQRHTCDGPLAPIVERSTELDPARRFRDVRMLRDALLTALSEPPESHGVKAGEWAELLEESESWDAQRLDEFARFIERTDTASDDASLICRALNDYNLIILHKIEDQAWSKVADFYCTWAHGNFPFAYCDVIATRLVTIFGLGGPSIKSMAILALARLGRSHNRWFVMQQLMNVAGPKLDDTVAGRVAIEIRVSEAEGDFVASAEAINRDLSDFHPRIAQVIVEDQIPF